MAPNIKNSIKTKDIKPLEGRAYDPKEVESDWYAIWEGMGAFKPEYDGAGRARNNRPWCCIIPPPNITDQLHMGHGLNFTLQDLVTRIRRMEGFDVLWLPGIDHAGIATQVQVEKSLKAKGTSRKEIGYDEFIKRAWKWKEAKGGRILDQIRELGSSCDWDRLRFTLDPGPSRGVATAFKQLYDKGYIYRGTYMVNWSRAEKRDQRSRSGLSGRAGRALLHQLSVQGRLRRASGGDHSPGNHARQHSGRGESKRRAF